MATTLSIISQIDIFFLELKSPFGTLKIKLPEIKLHDECNQEHVIVSKHSVLSLWRGREKHALYISVAC